MDGWYGLGGKGITRGQWRVTLGVSTCNLCKNEPSLRPVKNAANVLIMY